MKTSELIAKYKKGGVVTNTVVGVAMLIISVIIMFVIVQSLTNANLLGSGAINHSAPLTQAETMRESFGNLTTNYTSGIDNISAKIPTILLIVAVVFLFGALVLLVQQARNMGFGSGAGDGL